ncbi:MAG TPA: SCO family protein [Vicinamibacterales bacterium]|nr:SCO family protein [Vicinamibacterales bacterium]
MRTHIVFLIGLALAAAACATKTDQRVFTLQGQVLAVHPERKLIEIKGEEVKGFMPAMTMPYDVRDVKLLDGLAPGDLVNAQLVVESNTAYVSAIKKVGAAPLEKPQTVADEVGAAPSGTELLKPGDAAPDGRFVDQDGRTRAFAAFKGAPTVVTFIYTKCPMPTFCPLLDRNFAAVQKKLQTDPSLAKLKGRVQLVSVSFDPQVDTPAVLKQHAETLGADRRVWTFLTGDRDQIDRFASRFGVQVVRAANNPRDITHNLRTAIVGADGTLVKIYTGNEWTPDQLLADLKGL